MDAEATRDTEHTPLLPEQESTPEDAPESRTRKTVHWLSLNAVPIFISLLIAGVIAILCVYFFAYRAQRPSPRTSLCLTPACVHASSEILYNLSPNYKEVDPCTDFHEFSCGGWTERHDIRSDQGIASTGSIMEERSQTLLRHILEKPYPDGSKHSDFSPAQLAETLSSADQENFSKLKTAYDACMDEESIRKAGIEPLIPILRQIIDTFPVNRSTSSKNTPLHAADEKLAHTLDYTTRLGLSALVSLGAGADDKDPDVVVVQASPPRRIGLPAKDYYSDDKVLKSYEATLAKVFSNFHRSERDSARTGSLEFGGHESISLAEESARYAHEVVEFERKLAAASPNAEDRDDVQQYYNPLSLKDADLLTPHIHLSTIINSLSPPSVKVERLIVTSPQYMKKLEAIISDTAEDVLQAYFLWKAIHAYASDLDADELKPYTQFLNQLQGKDADSKPERWRTCVGHVDEGLSFILGRFFVEVAFSAKAKDFGDQIVSDIKETFIEKLKVSAWVDKSVVKLAIDKVHKIVQKIGYPTKSPDITDPLNLKDYYNSINVTSTYFDNALSMNHFDVDKEWSSLGKPVDREQWDMTVSQVNAYYNPPGNEIVFPAGIMQFPVFDVEVPQYLSYGAFGAVSGHELSHAFDSTGRHYDQNGNYTDWWTEHTVKGFTQRADCFVDQYHNFTVPGPDGTPLHVNGKLTLGENIADAGGVSAAFAAWQKRRAESSNADLPGLDYFTHEQLFFVNYANWWCAKSRPETAINGIYTNPHSPPWARVLGTVANSRDFRKSFNCPVKEPVCELW